MTTPTHDTKGLLGLLGIWASWLLGHLNEIQQGLQMCATLAALIASLIYARYYWKKTRAENQESKYARRKR